MNFYASILHEYSLPLVPKTVTICNQKILDIARAMWYTVDNQGREAATMAIIRDYHLTIRSNDPDCPQTIWWFAHRDDRTLAEDEMAALEEAAKQATQEAAAAEAPAADAPAAE